MNAPLLFEWSNAITIALMKGVLEDGGGKKKKQLLPFAYFVLSPIEDQRSHLQTIYLLFLSTFNDKVEENRKINLLRRAQLQRE
jgi:hypothetical protein